MIKCHARSLEIGEVIKAPDGSLVFAYVYPGDETRVFVLYWGRAIAGVFMLTEVAYYHEIRGIVREPCLTLEAALARMDALIEENLNGRTTE